MQPALVTGGAIACPRSASRLRVACRQKITWTQRRPGSWPAKRPVHTGAAQGSRSARRNLQSRLTVFSPSAYDLTTGGHHTGGPATATRPRKESPHAFGDLSANRAAADAPPAAVQPLLAALRLARRLVAVEGRAATNIARTGRAPRSAERLTLIPYAARPAESPRAASARRAISSARTRLSEARPAISASSKTSEPSCTMRGR